MPSALQVRRAVALSHETAPGEHRSMRHAPAVQTSPTAQSRSVATPVASQVRTRRFDAQVATPGVQPVCGTHARLALQRIPIAQSRSSTHSTQRIAAVSQTSPPTEQSRDERHEAVAAHTLETQRRPGSQSMSATQSTQRIRERSHTCAGHIRDEVQGVAATQRPLAHTGVAPPQ